MGKADHPRVSGLWTPGTEPIPAPMTPNRNAALEAMIEEATVDTYGDDEQLTGLFTMIEEHLAVPCATAVLGIEATVQKVDLTAVSSRSAAGAGTGRRSTCSTCRYPLLHRTAPRGSTPTGIGQGDKPGPAPRTRRCVQTGLQEAVRTKSPPQELEPPGNTAWTVRRPGTSGWGTAWHRMLLGQVGPVGRGLWAAGSLRDVPHPRYSRTPGGSPCRSPAPSCSLTSLSSSRSTGCCGSLSRGRGDRSRVRGREVSIYRGTP
ncbi:hypothetical protein EDC02_6933 [Micromonospora sp. Llam0]|nr:hypothetical protein EDC02_6933 [Micromonospora sp. Llam0]